MKFDDLKRRSGQNTYGASQYRKPKPQGLVSKQGKMKGLWQFRSANGNDAPPPASTKPRTSFLPLFTGRTASKTTSVSQQSAGQQRPLPRQSQNVRSSRGDISLFFFLSLSIVTLVVSYIKKDQFDEWRMMLMSEISPLLALTSEPLKWSKFLGEEFADYTYQKTILSDLRRQNRELKQLEGRRVFLEQQIVQLQKLANLKPGPEMSKQTVRVIANSAGPFLNSALIALGQSQQIKIGYAAVNSDGLVGRVVETGKTASRILLLNDVNSRVPVRIGPEGIRGIVQGNRSLILDLIRPLKGGKINEGDIVLSSGHGGLLPAGLRIGTVTKIKKNLMVKLSADLSNLDFVSIIHFEGPRLKTAGRLQKQLRPAGPPDQAGGQALLKTFFPHQNVQEALLTEKKSKVNRKD